MFSLAVDRRLDQSQSSCLSEAGCDLKNVDESTGLTKHGQSALLEHCYRRHVKPKKQHEIVHLAKVSLEYEIQICHQCYRSVKM